MSLATLITRFSPRVFTKANSVKYFSTSSAVRNATPTANEDLTQTLLEATLPFIPEHGWTMESIVRGIEALGYPSVAHGIFEDGEAGLVDAFLTRSRRQHVESIQKALASEEFQSLVTIDKVKHLTALRLDLVKPYAHNWHEALAIMAHPSNVPSSLKHLAELVDDVLYYAGDRSPDFNWYTKRAGLAAVYTSTELFMTQDRSVDYVETLRFLDRRFNEVEQLETAKREVGTMLEFGAKSFIGLLGTRGIRF